MNSEEKILAEGLEGYKEYMQKVKFISFPKCSLNIEYKSLLL